MKVKKGRIVWLMDSERRFNINIQGFGLSGY
jgi:hypothetical protein